MAITKILHIKEAGKTTPGKHLKQAIQYICNPQKTQEGMLIGSLNCQSDNAYQQMIQTKKYFQKLNLRQGYHIIISFEEGEIEPERAFEIVGRFARQYLEKDYEAIYAIHDDTMHVHGHIIFNSVSYRTGRKYRYERGDWKKQIQPIVNQLCEEHSLSIIDLDEQYTEGRRSWQEYQAENKIWNSMIRRDLNECIWKADSFEQFQELLKEKGYALKSGKHFAIKPPGMKRFRRCKSLGTDYTEERIRERIQKETFVIKNTPSIKRVYMKRYKRVPLTDLQRKYYAKLFRTGVLRKRPYSQAWKYKKEILQMERLQREYQFLCRNDISDTSRLHEKIHWCEKRKKSIEKERRRLYRQKYDYQKQIQLYEMAKYLSHAVCCYQNGDKYFHNEYEEYRKIERVLKADGYTLGDIEKIQDYYKEHLGKIREEEKWIREELNIARQIQRENKSYQEIRKERSRQSFMR